ncbi:hypothetical protein HOE67_02990 [Candidatus Peregrinibacteria bacterium]|jgi:glycosyltransferase involved in cell wall biosynthesis|nr:hypothetical protein [Candidatus Peregrinibacteria bacterium]MBT4056051.1 hypothetical protein [Candidatus Peregrinibacteria bacterium]
MKRVLIFGNGPLPNDNVKKRPSEGLRTWQFVKSLIGGRVRGEGKTGEILTPKAGLNLRLVTIALGDCYGEESAEATAGENAGASALRKDFHHSANFIHHQFSENDPALLKMMQAVCDEFQPDVVVAVNLKVAYLVSKLRFDGKFWADLKGWAMSKAQIESHKLGDDRLVREFSKMEEAVLKQADAVSCVSESQKFATLGELALLRRLGGETFEKEFVYAIENALEDFEIDKIEKVISEVPRGPSMDNAWSAGTFEQVEEDGLRYFRGDSAFCGANVPSNAFVVLWMGGYSAWVDEETLFRGVEGAMAAIEEREGQDARRKIYFVSTGGISDGHDASNKTFLRFKELIDLSRFKDQFKFLGWVAVRHLPYIYQEADIGLNVDRICLETLTGARNRLCEMIKFKLPVVTTLGTEISYKLAGNGACKGIESGSADGVRDGILELFHNPARRKDYCDKGRKYFDERCSYNRVMKPFVKWIDETPVVERVDGGKGGAAGSARSAASKLSNFISRSANKKS